MDEIRPSKYISLTTYRKNGAPVSTPLWHVERDGELLVLTAADSWKVKRIRNNPAVDVTVCDVRGRTAPDAPTASGTARILDEAGTAATRVLLAEKYLLSRVGGWLRKGLRLRQKPHVGIAVTL
ncbi:PPOX class F420-dependent oxidoreductase [Streptomyces sp. KL116D]|uniref:PPOX class F420-dependent oxidoreductase n=1 Tax=Streptomyces sp. KL116D TaxID=3045152 RepID=UPI003556F3C0